ncbi:hypothetical protein GH714_027587 [Hevea brasiliensis]|uniref:FAR1 domain-containing protein n=1 Tax=Hevea brasiliensis TaxID=3981 RepID=A0A6A6K745_HEVBR|nr:hypothetical protein GH714_027587 [Hevea brasiliensis]
MEFESEDAARKFYIEYARRVGFVVRIMQRRRSGIDGEHLLVDLDVINKVSHLLIGAQLDQIRRHDLVHEKGDKDKKIEELTEELEHQEQLCAVYRERLLSFMNNVEEQTEELSSKIKIIVDNVRKVESEVQKLSHRR